MIGRLAFSVFEPAMLVCVLMPLTLQVRP